MAVDGRLDVLEPIQEIVVGPVVGTRLFPCSDPPLDLTQVLEIYTGFYERSHGDTIKFRPENLRVCLDYLYK